MVRDGHVAAYVLRERHCRTKHAISLQFENIEAAVRAAQLRWDQIDYCAITSTQNIELIIDDPANFSITLDPHPNHQAPCTLADLVRAQNIDPASMVAQSLMDIFYNPRLRESYLYHHYGHAFPEHRNRQPGDFTRFGWIDQQINSSLWTEMTLDQIAVADFSSLMGDDGLRYGCHFPVTVNLAGRVVAGYYIGHHAAHAAANYYQSGFDQAAILSHDGGAAGPSFLSGMFFRAEGSRIYPIVPHHLAIGCLYEMTGLSVGMGHVGPPGKLMGLAAYGRPRFFDRAFVGNRHDWSQRGAGIDQWLHHCLRLAQEMGYDLAPFGRPEQATAPINIDIAASTQKLFEETYLVAVETLYKVLQRAGRLTSNLCLTGGCALNCPSNSRVFREGRFPHLFVEPGCDDSGLAIGAATFLYHNVLDQPRRPRTPDAYSTPFLGIEVGDDRVERALAAAADDLAANRIIGWYEGRSEIGPRALGHRSILADPRRAENWPRVNALKGREHWRPFAPAVLASEANNWFIGMPASSPYMLFTANVRSSQLPAITHIDGSARVQTVDASCGRFFRIIEQFHARTGVPVVLNTSFNGPGEPIVESPEDALRFLAASALDALYMGRFRVTRRPATQR